MICRVLGVSVLVVLDDGVCRWIDYSVWAAAAASAWRNGNFGAACHGSVSIVMESGAVKMITH